MIKNLWNTRRSAAPEVIAPPQVLSTPDGGIVIDTPGNYFLACDMVVEGDFAIRVNSDNVVLDLNGKTIRKAAPSDKPSFGVHVTKTQGLKIYNGKVNGFSHGVHSVSSSHVQIIGVDASRSTNIGFTIGGGDVRVVGCRADDIGGFSSEAYAVGVNIFSGHDMVVERCHFSNIYRQPDADPALQGEGCGVICAAIARSTTIVGNVIVNDRVEPKTIGVFGGQGGAHVLKNNLIRNFHTAIMGGGVKGFPTHAVGNALWLDSPVANSEGLCVVYGTIERNLVVGFERGGRPTVETALNTIFEGSRLASDV